MDYWKWSIFGSLGWSMRSHVRRGNEEKQMATVGLKLNFIGVIVLALAAYGVWGWLL